MKSIVHIDLDGVITKDPLHPKSDCLNAEPNKKVVDWIKRVREDNVFVVIYTARKYKYAEDTLEWLDKNNVQYDAINFKKAPYDLLIDDKAVNSYDYKFQR